MAKKLDEEDQITVVLEKAPKDYASIMANAEWEYGNTLCMKHLEEAMKIQFRIQYGNDKDQNAGGNKLTLSDFHGTCYHCNETGHKANNCPKKKSGYGGKFKSN
eukprot:15364799-Ditylum_brightwellii.AAC.2